MHFRRQFRLVKEGHIQGDFFDFDGFDGDLVLFLRLDVKCDNGEIFDWEDERPFFDLAPRGMFPVHPTASKRLRSVARLPRGKIHRIDRPFSAMGVSHLGAELEWLAKIGQFDDDLRAGALDDGVVEKVIEIRTGLWDEIPNQLIAFHDVG